jgi:hypothetical protein
MTSSIGGPLPSSASTNEHRFVESYSSPSSHSAFCKAAAGTGLSCLTIGAIERLVLLTRRPSY